MCRHNLPQIQVITSMQFSLMGNEKSFTRVQGPQICSVMIKVLLLIMCPFDQRTTPRQEDQTQVYMWMKTFDLR